MKRFKKTLRETSVFRFSGAFVVGCRNFVDIEMREKPSATHEGLIEALKIQLSCAANVASFFLGFRLFAKLKTLE